MLARAKPAPESGDEDVETVPHWQVYDALVVEASQLGGYRKFIQSTLEMKTLTHLGHPPDRSTTDVNDITAYVVAQRTWGGQDQHQPQANRLWEHPGAHTMPTYTVGDMMHQGRVVVGLNGDHVRDFRNLPKAISSKVEGWRVNAWVREDERIGHDDIMARLRTEVVANTRKRIFSKRKIEGRLTRARDALGLIAWNRRDDAAGRGKKQYFDSLRSAHQKANNLSVGRSLTQQERAAAKSRAMNTRHYATTGASNAAYIAGIQARAGASSSNVAGQSGQAGEEDSDEEESETEENVEGDDMEEDESEEEDDGSGDEGAGEADDGGVVEDDEQEHGDNSIVDGAEEPSSDHDEDWEDVSDGLDDALPQDPIDDSEVDHEDDGAPSHDESSSDSSSDDNSQDTPSLRVPGMHSDPQDSRNDTPADAKERKWVSMALAMTISHFRTLTGARVFHRGRTSSYSWQWRRLQDQLDTWYNTNKPAESKPQLVYRHRWEGGIRNAPLGDDFLVWQLP